MTNVWCVKNILANCDGNMYLPISHLPKVNCKKNCTVRQGLKYPFPRLGICGGDNSSCLGCDGVPNSGQIKDSCGVCGGDGSTCTNITSVHPSLLPSTSTSGRTVNVVGAGLDGDSIKCIFDGQESPGRLCERLICV